MQISLGPTMVASSFLMYLLYPFLWWIVKQNAWEMLRGWYAWGFPVLAGEILDGSALESEDSEPWPSWRFLRIAKSVLLWDSGYQTSEACGVSRNQMLLTSLDYKFYKTMCWHQEISRRIWKRLVQSLPAAQDSGQSGSKASLSPPNSDHSDHSVYGTSESSTEIAHRAQTTHRRATGAKEATTGKAGDLWQTFVDDADSPANSKRRTRTLGLSVFFRVTQMHERQVELETGYLCTVPPPLCKTIYNDIKQIKTM